MGMATIMARLSTLEVALAQSQAENYMGRAELEKVRMENGKLREALIAPQYEDEEADTYAAVPGTGVQAMPESFLMTPQKPPAPSPLSEGDWATEWEQLPANPPGFARDGPAQLPGTSWWTKSAWEREPWCAPAWGTAWQSPPQCDPWAEYRTSAARAEKAWPPQPWGSQPWSQQAGDQGSDWGDQWCAGWGGWSRPLRAPDRKDVDRPAKYSGDITKWLQWSTAFSRFLRRQDWRWPSLLEKIQDLRGRLVTAEDERWWSWELNLGEIGQYKDYLNEYLLSFTEGTAREVVSACGVLNALDAWRQLTERGDSLRPTHIMALQKTAFFPREAVPAKDLDVAIAQWESDIQRWEVASKERIQPSHRRLSLDQMCPERLRAHLRLVGPEKLPTYEAMRAEIADWLAEELRKPAKQRAAAIGPAAGASQEWETPGEDGDWDSETLKFMNMPLDELDREQLMALVKNVRGKKGGGKGGKGGKGPRKCYECDGEGHIASECPIRIERVKNGGPERLPKNGDVNMDGAGGKGKGGKGKGGKGAGKSTFPPKSQWKDYNPDPNVIQNSNWMRWHPANKSQLSLAAENGGWMTAPGAMLSLRSLTQKSVPVHCSNKFEALQKEDDELDEEDQSDAKCTNMSEGSKKMKKEENDNGSSPSPTPRTRWLCKPRVAHCSKECCHGQGVRRAIGVASDEVLTETPGKAEKNSTWAIGPNLSVLSEKRPAQTLMPVSSSEWEYVEFILDSGATTIVIPLSVGKAYEVQPSEASKAGVMYEIANGDEIQNLGEKLMPVVTAEGAWKGLLAQVADISKALQSVRSLVKAGHVVVFGDDDESGDGGNYIVNKLTGEYTSVRDDGLNYILGLHIAPKHEAGFARPEAQ